MAAIDKIYVNNYAQYLQFREWCEQQPLLVDKYGKKEKITNYLYNYEERPFGEFPIFMAPCYVDAYVIRNCPFDFIQKEMMLNYGHHIQEETGEESVYSKIKRGYLYSSPLADVIYEVGKHFKCTKHPAHRYNTPFGCRRWFVDIITPDEVPFMWYHQELNTWDFCKDYVIANWNSSTAHIKTIRALKRLIIKWKFPVGTIVRATGRYIEDDYEFVVKK